MSLNKKVLAAAIVSGLFATSAQAQVYLSGSSTTASDPVKLANEVIIGAAGTTAANVGNALNLEFAYRYNFSADEVRYARVECGSGVRFRTGNTVISGAASDSAFDNFGAINGLNTSVITFSVSSIGGGILSTNRFNVTGSRSIRSNAGPISCSYSLYDEPSQAAAGGTAGRITTVSGTYLTFGPSLALETTPNTAYADVESDPVFTLFAADDANDIDAGDTAQIGGFSFGEVNTLDGDVTQPINLVDGNPMQISDLLGGDTFLLVEGDFTAAEDSANTAFLSWNEECTGGVYSMYTYADYAIYYTGNNEYVDYFVCFQADGETAIPASDYTATIVTENADELTYNVANYGATHLGTIARNGTQLQAPLAQVPTGWLSRMVLTNTGSQDRPYQVAVQGEVGNTIGTDNLTGTIPAGKTVVVDLSTVLKSFTGASRATLNVSVAGPNSQIQGLYQIVNPASGSLSNHVMVRPGTN